MMGLRVGGAWLAVSLAGACGATEELAPEPEARAPEPAAPASSPAPERAPEPVAVAPRPKTLGTMQETIAKAEELHAAHRQTLLCGCRYSDAGRVSPASCGYRTRADDRLAKRVQWGHVVPPHDFGATRACWTQPLCTGPDGGTFRGIECCQQIDPEFAAMRGDLHNIAPMVGEVATDRSNYAFGEIEGEPRLYGSCDLEIDRDEGRIEPPPEIRGDIARVYFYMAQTYPGALALGAEQLAQLKAWEAEDPPDAWETERARAVAAVQGVAPAWLSKLPPAAVPAPEPSAETVAASVDQAPPEVTGDELAAVTGAAAAAKGTAAQADSSTVSPEPRAPDQAAPAPAAPAQRAG